MVLEGSWEVFETGTFPHPTLIGAPKDHMKIRILQTMISGMPLLGTRKCEILMFMWLLGPILMLAMLSFQTPLKLAPEAVQKCTSVDRGQKIGFTVDVHILCVYIYI